MVNRKPALTPHEARRERLLKIIQEWREEWEKAGWYDDQAHSMNVLLTRIIHEL